MLKKLLDLAKIQLQEVGEYVEDEVLRVQNERGWAELKAL